MINGHSSHQIGLDADIWFTPMPDHVQSREEREFSFPADVVAKNQQDVDPEVWTHTRTDLIRTAAQDPAVTRIFVNAAIKKALCRESGPDRTWLAKVRPWYGHAEHFHVRIGCPADSPACKSQPPVSAGDGCGHELDHWIKHPVLPPAPSLIPEKPKPGIALAPPAARMQRNRDGAVRRAIDHWQRPPCCVAPNSRRKRLSWAIASVLASALNVRYCSSGVASCRKEKRTLSSSHNVDFGNSERTPSEEKKFSAK